MTEILRKNSNWLTELRFYNCVFDDSKLFIELMKTIPKLKKLVMFQVVTLESFRSLEDSSPVFDKLEHLDFVMCEYRLLYFLKAAKLTSFKFFDSEDGSTGPLQPLTDFLSTQTSLKTFAIRSIDANDSHLFKVPFEPEQIPFKLKKLSLLKFKLRYEPNDYNNLVKFIQVHASILEELEIGQNFPEFIYELIFSKLKKLKTLNISMRGLPDNAEFYERLEPNSSVKQLIISDDFLCGDFQSFVQHLPNVEMIVTSENFDAESFRVIANCCDKLRHLEIVEMKEIFSELVFPQLEKLYIDCVFEPIDWSRFVVNIPKLKELHIKTIATDQLGIEEISTNLNIQVLRLGANFVSDFDFFDSIRRNCKDLNLLVVHRESIAIDESETTDIRALRFHSDSVFNRHEFPNAGHGEFWTDDYGGKLLEDDGESYRLDPFDLQEMLDEMGIVDEDDEEFYDEDDEEGWWLSNALSMTCLCDMEIEVNQKE